MKCMRFEFPIFRWCIHRWKNHLTWNGKWALIAWFLSVPGLIAVDTALPTVCFALAAVLLLAAVLSYRGRPQLELRWVADEICSQDGRSELVIYAKNATNRSLRELELALVNVPKSWKLLSAHPTISQLDPGETARRIIEMVPTRRGCFALPSVRVASSYPLSLFRLGDVQSFGQELIVLPDYRHLDPQQYQGLLATSGRCATRESLATGNSDDYVASREYQSDMNVRRWDYRAWARLGRPIVCEFGMPSRVVVAVWVDSRATLNDRFGTDGKDTERGQDGVDRRVALAASVIEAVLAEDDLLQFVASPSERLDLDTFTSAEALSASLRWLAQLPTLDAEVHGKPSERTASDGVSGDWLFCVSDRHDDGLDASIRAWHESGWQVIVLRTESKNASPIANSIAHKHHGVRQDGPLEMVWTFDP